MRIIINQVTSSKTFMLEVKPYYTGLTVKNKIKYIYDFPCEEHFLIYESVRLKDDSVLSDLYIDDGHSLFLVDPKYTAPKSFPIFYKLAGGTVDTIYVHASLTIENLKLMISGKTGTPPEQMQLKFGPKQLKDELIISDYNIQQRSTLFLSACMERI